MTAAHDLHNPDLLRAIPESSRHVIEVGCSSGALAREFKRLNPSADYAGIELVPAYAELARRYCDQVVVADIEALGEGFFDEQAHRDAWVFGDALEHLRDPWRILRLVRDRIPATGCVAACIPNMQHWSVQARLAVGELSYEPSGLLDATHLRWFTRKTIIELFEECGYQVELLVPRVFEEPASAPLFNAIAELARLVGGDVAQSREDARALQYIVRAVPGSAA